MSSVAQPQHAKRTPPAEALGNIVHELRQPLSNIEAVAYHLSLQLSDEGEEVQSLLARIRQLVEQADRILSSALRLSAPLVLSPTPSFLPDAVERAIAERGVDRALVRVESSAGLPDVQLDPQHGPFMIEVLLQIMLGPASAARPLRVRVSPGQPRGVCLEMLVELRAGGLGAGSELAMECARRIAQAHGGTLVHETARNNVARVAVMLP